MFVNHMQNLSPVYPCSYSPDPFCSQLGTASCLQSYQHHCL